VLEPIGPDGKFGKATHFASGLNIPIGNVPLGGGNEALVYAIPSIFRVTDTDGDGISDKRETVYTRFGNVDTHGNSNGYRRWIDGWIYGCHGFSNTSEITDGGGRITKMNSGNTYRFKEDGSHFQQFTWGQVNPFGMAFDPWGNLFDSDCHTMPIYLLLRGAYYESFGKPDDGLGFGPKMITHLHGSTGICGPAFYAADQFPEAYRNSLFICNPVNGQVHHDKLKQVGSTFLCDTQPDFITCGDEWFRPVDAVVGPDGALYIADFHNAVIGHYEQPLEHPKRDRETGRVWRIVYKGTDGKSTPKLMPNLVKLELERLVPLLGDANLVVRTLATNQLVDRARNADLKKKVWGTISARLSGEVSPEFMVHALWVLERIGLVSNPDLILLASHKSPLVRTHLIRVLAERPQLTEENLSLVRQGLAAEHGMVRRVAADALGRHLDPENVPLLLYAWAAADPADTHLVHTIRIALRDHLNDREIAKTLAGREFDANHKKRLVEIASVAKGEMAAALLLKHAEGALDADILRRAAPQIARYGDSVQIERLVELAQTSLAANSREQFSVFQLLAAGLAQRGEPAEKNAAAKAWFEKLGPQLLADIESASVVWTNHPVPNLPPSANPFGLRDRKSADGKSTKVIDSIANGEQLTGILRSREFKIPERLSFYMCGHNGLPETNPPPVNHVRLVLAETGEEIAREIPPRNDTAKKYTWNLKNHAGKNGIFEIVDAHTGAAFAWLGVGRFDPPVLPLLDANSEKEDARFLELAGQLGPASFAPRLAALAEAGDRPAEVRAAAAAAAVKLGAAERLTPLLGQMLGRANEPDVLRKRAAELLGAMDADPARKLLVAGLAQAPAGLQRDMAMALCSQPAGAAALVAAVAAGKASGRLLQDPQLAERFKSAATPELQKQAGELLKNLPPVEQRLVALVLARTAGFAAAKPSAERGAAVFKKNCAACHKLGNEGFVIGPQLEGIGARGPTRILEDLLDPNRNVDAAFRTTVIETEDGNVVTGLFRRQEGKVLVLADSQGKEVRLREDEIAKRRPSELSLMPTNLAEVVKEDELYDLLAFLLAQKQAKAP
jgi:putative heme-binding domain-containing protein